MRAFVVSVVLLLGVSRPVGATVMLPADLGDLSREAFAIALRRSRRLSERVPRS